jgi:hypothetical protein
VKNQESRVTIELIVHGESTDKCFDFSLRHATGDIPATFWNSDGSAGSPPPITLVQHGGTLHKRHERTNWLAESIVAATGSAVLLIDGPIHGQRRTAQPQLEAVGIDGGDSYWKTIQAAVNDQDWVDKPDDTLKMLAIFKQYWREDAGIDGIVSDWKMALDAVLDRGWADPDRVAWLGVSMGTAYGIPVCAADTRIKAAAMGMWGLDWGQETRLVEDARRMRIPVLFQIKEADEIFSTEGQRALFDALGCPNKCLRTHPGGHGLHTPGTLDELLDFISQFHKAPRPQSNSAERQGKSTA